MRKLTVVVACTERKSLLEPAHLRVRNLPMGSMKVRSGEWLRRLARPAAQRPLIDLYQGEAWCGVKDLLQEAQVQGFATRLLVASAGLGLREVTEPGPSYGATFSGGHPDSVGVTRLDSARWWATLRQAPDALDPTTSVRGRVLLVLSETYARAMKDDLAVLGQTGGDMLMVGGSTDIPGLPRLPADMALRRTLGGTAGSINLRMATRWLSDRSGRDLYSDTDHQRWIRWATGTRSPEVYQREPMTDRQILDFVASVKAAEPELSATRALGQLRQAGRACEHKRFGRLFHSVAAVS